MSSPLYYSCTTDGGDADATSHAVEYEYEVRTSPGDVDRAAGEVRRLLAERAAAAAGLAGCADAPAGAGRRKRRLGAQGGQRGPPSPRRALRPGGRGSTSVVAVSSPLPDAVEEGVPCAILGATFESATDENGGGARSEDAADGPDGPDGWDEHDIEAVFRVDGSPPVVTRRKKRKRTGGRTAGGGSDRTGGGFEAHMGHVARSDGRGGEPEDSPGYAYNYASTRDVPLDRSSRTGHNPIDPPAAFAERSDSPDAPGKTLSFRARSVDPATVVRPRSSLVCAVVRGSLTVYTSEDTGGYAGSNLGERVLHSLVSDVNGRGMRPAGGSVAELRMVTPSRPSRSGSSAGAIAAVKPSESGGATSPYLYPLIGLAALAVLLAGLFVRTGRRGRSETGPLESDLRDAKALDSPNKDGDGGTDCGTVCDVSDERDGVVTTTTTRSHLVPAEGQGWIQGGLSDLAEYAGWVVRSLTRDAEDDDREVEEARAREKGETRDRAGSEPPPGTRWRTDAGRENEAGSSHRSQTAPRDDGKGQDGLPAGKNARRSSFLGALFPPQRKWDGGDDDARAATAASGRYYDITSRSRCPTPTNGYGQEVDSAYFFGTAGTGGGRDDDRVGLMSGGRGGGGVRAALGRSMGWLGSRSFGGGGDGGDDDEDGGGYGSDGSDFSVDLDVREVRSVQPPAPPRGISASSPAPSSGGWGRAGAGRRRRDLASPLSVERGSGSAVVASPDVAAAAEPSLASPVTVPGDQPSLASPLTVPWDEAGTVLSSAYDACDVGGAFAAYDGVTCDVGGFVNWFRGGK
mmetsp:Transcript_5091/g.11537  ORF Transcript_5091/g.11537 Transcript_5091/m.11537 type:complete len:800 (+) Transcript_5091:252-2651(+)